MDIRTSTLKRGVLVVVGVLSIVVGVTLVVEGERTSRLESAVFAESQIGLRSTFGVFDTRAASEPLTTPANEGSSQSGEGAGVLPSIRDAVALVAIPSIKLEVAATSYRNYDDLRYAIGYMPESTPPNEPGITYFVGHRTGFGAPFRDLDQLRIGDTITVKSAAGIITSYEVEFVEIRKPTDDIPELSRLTGVSNILLVTCHPEFSTELRLIVGASGE